MNDDQYLKNMSKRKKSSLEAELDDDTAAKAKKIEKKNYSKVKNARKKLQKAEAVHKDTTQEIKKQNEKLEGVRHSKIAEEAERAREIAITLENEKSAVNPFSGVQSKFQQMKSKTGGGGGNIRKMTHDNEGDDNNEATMSSEMNLADDEGATKEEKETNDELRKMYKTMRSIKKETKVQSRDSKKQKSKLVDIMKTTEDTKKSVKKTNEMVEKDL